MRNVPGRVGSPWGNGSHRVQARPSSRCSLVESNFYSNGSITLSSLNTSSRASTPIIPEVHIRTRSRPREISINDAPMMLLPRARVRDTTDYLHNQRAKSCTVIADTSTQGLHISTIQAVDSVEFRVAPPKSALKNRRNSITRSEADSGISSLKRAVTFDNLSQSQSTLFNVEDDLDSLSDQSGEDHLDYVDDDLNCGHRIEVEFPDHLDTFGTGEAIITTRKSDKARSKSRNGSASSSKAQAHGVNDARAKHTCKVCGTVLSETEEVKKAFGKVDVFLDWVMSKWGKKRRELQYIPRASYVYRGHVPHFCNFVQPLALHTKSSGSHGDGSLSGVPQEDDEEEDEELKYITETADGRLINKWRKDSNSSSRDRDRTPVPPLDEYLDESTKSSIPEMKEDGLNSGTEGRPGSPNSQDGADGQTNGNEPVMGIVNVTVASPRRSEPSGTKSKIHLSDVSKDIEILDSYVGTSMPVVPEETQSSSDRPSSSAISDTKRKGADSLLILTNVDRDLDSTSNGHLSNGRPPSPHRPPPSPEPQKLPVTKASEPPTTGRKRGCINKKVKKPIERTRKTKATESSSPEPVLLESEKMESLATPTTDSEKAEGKVELQVPDLPSGVEEKKSKKKEKSKPKRHLIEAEDDLFKQDATDVLNDQLKQNRVDIDFSNMDTNGADDLKRPPQIKSWIQGRLALSQQSSRFELPMDMKNLETMTPEEYIRKHCIITSRRQNLYSKIFLKNKDKTHCIPYKELDRSLKDVLVHTITSEQVQSVLDTFGITENTKVDFKYFAGMAAFAERILYPKYVTEDTVDMPEYQREKIECADFCALDWKFHGIKINPKMLHLLNQLR